MRYPHFGLSANIRKSASPASIPLLRGTSSVEAVNGHIATIEGARRISEREHTMEIMAMRRKKLLAMIGAGLLVIAGSVTVISVGVANAEETTRLCAVGLDEGARATTSAKAASKSAETALETVKSTALPGGAGTSANYADRPGVTAIPAVTAVEASVGVEAVAGVGAVAARASGTDAISDVTSALASLVKVKILTECDDRDQAATISGQVSAAKTATKTLDADVEALTGDFTVFQSDETARIAAEIEAARVAAEVEAARVAAETEAARVAANAARAAAEQAAAEEASYSDSSDSGSSYSGSSTGGGTSSGGGASSGGGTSSGGRPSGPPLGGGMGFGDSGQCLTSNGMGGTKLCGT